jgi:Lrp/AsnC family leucine-responsive transcriptional regulator
VRKLELSGVIRGYRAIVDPQRLGYGIRALVRVGRVEYQRMVKLIEQAPEVVNAWNVTGADSWVLEIAVIDVEHLDAVVTRFCLLSETSTSIVLNAPREGAPLLPARRENIKPPIRKVTGR